MAKSRKLREVEQSRGNLKLLIPRLVNERGQKGAADELGVSATTISLWLKKHGYTPIIQYIRKGEQES